MPRPRYNWEAIRARYVYGDDRPSLRDLVIEFSCPLETMARHSKAGDWPGERQRFVNKTATKSEEIASTRKAVDQAEITDSYAEAWRTIRKMLRALLPTDYGNKEAIAESVDALKKCQEAERLNAGMATSKGVTVHEQPEPLDEWPDDDLRDLRELVRERRGAGQSGT